MQEISEGTDVFCYVRETVNPLYKCEMASVVSPD